MAIKLPFFLFCIILSNRFSLYNYVILYILKHKLILLGVNMFNINNKGCALKVYNIRTKITF